MFLSATITTSVTLPPISYLGFDQTVPLEEILKLWIVRLTQSPLPGQRGCFMFLLFCSACSLSSCGSPLQCCSWIRAVLNKDFPAGFFWGSSYSQWSPEMGCTFYKQGRCFVGVKGNQWCLWTVTSHLQQSTFRQPLALVESHDPPNSSVSLMLHLKQTKKTPTFVWWKDRVCFPSTQLQYFHKKNHFWKQFLGRLIDFSSPNLITLLKDFETSWGQTSGGELFHRLDNYCRIGPMGQIRATDHPPPPCQIQCTQPPCPDSAPCGTHAGMAQDVHHVSCPLAWYPQCM